MRGVAARQDQTAPEPLHMEQQIDFPGRLDATQLEGCWINVCCCCQGFRPTGPNTFVSSYSLMFGIIVCCNNGERYARVPGTKRQSVNGLQRYRNGRTALMTVGNSREEARAIDRTSRAI